MVASGPAKVAPLSVTVLLVPTFLSAKLAVPPVSDMSSPPIVPFTDRLKTSAAAVASYTLLAGVVKLPVIGFAVMSAFSVPTDVSE